MSIKLTPNIKIEYIYIRMMRNIKNPIKHMS